MKKIITSAVVYMAVAGQLTAQPPENSLAVGRVIFENAPAVPRDIQEMANSLRFGASDSKTVVALDPNWTLSSKDLKILPSGTWTNRGPNAHHAEGIHVEAIQFWASNRRRPLSLALGKAFAGYPIERKIPYFDLPVGEKDFGNYVARFACGDEKRFSRYLKGAKGLSAQLILEIAGYKARALLRSPRILRIP